MNISRFAKIFLFNVVNAQPFSKENCKSSTSWFVWKKKKLVSNALSILRRKTNKRITLSAQKEKELAKSVGKFSNRKIERRMISFVKRKS